ncbi:hypothetical protein GCM10025778_09290 [Paeniglutamicibacter antarcticus]|uniref:FAD:protein FMN transferase n=1 Tax=Paeniglutamicibacter antarcticus TaxID=494023 RepID=A0ABP9TJR0_9MICC
MDPALGRDLENLGYDRDLTSVQLHPRGIQNLYEPMVRRTPGWKRVRLQGNMLMVPADLRLDLGATAKADAADLAVAAVAEQTGSGVLVCLGGDLALAGHAPAGGWQVLVQDLETDPAQKVALEHAKAALAAPVPRGPPHPGSAVWAAGAGNLPAGKRVQHRGNRERACRSGPLHRQQHRRTSH